MRNDRVPTVSERPQSKRCCDAVDDRNCAGSRKKEFLQALAAATRVGPAKEIIQDVLHPTRRGSSRPVRGLFNGSVHEPSDSDDPNPASRRLSEFPVPPKSQTSGDYQ